MGIIDRGMKISGKLRFLEGEDTAELLLQQHASTLVRELAQFVGELQHRRFEYEALLAGRERLINALKAAAASPQLQQPQCLTHLLARRVREEERLLHADRLTAPGAAVGEEAAVSDLLSAIRLSGDDDGNGSDADAKAQSTRPATASVWTGAQSSSTTQTARTPQQARQ